MKNDDFEDFESKKKRRMLKDDILEDCERAKNMLRSFLELEMKKKRKKNVSSGYETEEKRSDRIPGHEAEERDRGFCWTRSEDKNRSIGATRCDD